MGARYVRGDGMAGPIDLAELASQEVDSGLTRVMLVSDLDVSYKFTALPETEVHDGILTSVHLSAESRGRSDDKIDRTLEALGLAVTSIHGWIAERRHFPNDGIVEVRAEEVAYGKPININGVSTRPIVRGFVLEKEAAKRGYFAWIPNF